MFFRYNVFSLFTCFGVHKKVEKGPIIEVNIEGIFPFLPLPLPFLLVLTPLFLLLFLLFSFGGPTLVRLFYVFVCLGDPSPVPFGTHFFNIGAANPSLEHDFFPFYLFL